MVNDPKKSLFNGFKNQLRSKWKDYRDQSFNQNTKGYAYEKALSDLLTDYFGGVFDIHTRAAIIDTNTKCFDYFTLGENEFDVIATFKQAKPQIVFEQNEMRWLPYNSVAFICETKSKLDSSSLTDDLEKVKKLRKISVSFENRFGVTITGKYTAKHQLNFLVYDRTSIAQKTLLQKTQDNLSAWDAILLVEEDNILVNPKLPYSNILPKVESISISGNGLVHFIGLISGSVPHPTSVNTINTLFNLMRD